MGLITYRWMIRGTAWIGLFLGASAWSAAPTYRVTDLGVPQGASSSQPAAINDGGEVLGHASVAESIGIRPFLWSAAAGSRWWDSVLVSGRNELGGLDNRARAVGTHQDGLGTPQAFVWAEQHGVRPLGALVPDGASFGNAINDRGQVAGSADAADGASHLFVWSGSQGMVDRHPAGSSSSYGQAINASGHVAGTMILPDGRLRAVLVASDGGWTKLGCIGSDNGQPCHSQAFGLNDLDEVVGVTGTGSHSRGFVWSAAQGMRDIAAGSPYADDEITARAINRAGQVVGTRFVHVDYSAVYWDATNGLHDIADLIDPADPLAGQVTFSLPVGINASGQIALTGKINGVGHAMVLTPLR